MLKKLSIVELHAAIKNKVEQKTGLRCYDEVPEDEPAPFYFAEIISKRPENTKTMWCEVFTVHIHVIAEKTKGSVAVYELIKKLEEAMTESVHLPDYVDLLMQTEQGMQNLKTDETGEKHAIMAYEFKVCYGFRTKV